MLYEGKAKQVFRQKIQRCCVLYIKTMQQLLMVKKGTISDKGFINNYMTNRLMQYLEKEGRCPELGTAFVETIRY